MTGLEIWKIAAARFGEKLPRDRKIMVRGVIRSLINLLVSDLLETTQKSASSLGIKTYRDARNAGRKIVRLSEDVARANGELKSFLRKKLYQHYRVVRMTMKAQKVVRELFTIYTEHPDTLPDDYQALIARNGAVRTAADYIAGMTDRFALEEHNKLTDPMIRV